MAIPPIVGGVFVTIKNRQSNTYLAGMFDAGRHPRAGVLEIYETKIQSEDADQRRNQGNLHKRQAGE